MGGGIVAILGMIPVGYTAKKSGQGLLCKLAVIGGSATVVPFETTLLNAMLGGTGRIVVAPLENPIMRLVFAGVLLVAYTIGEDIAVKSGQAGPDTAKSTSTGRS
jgi:hypothetical protein